jgi:xanthine dehydrogenase molybdopterin-binding subunit B
MKTLEATALRLLVSSVVIVVPACKKSPRASARPADAGTVVTVYAPSESADRIMGRLTAVAGRHHWTLSVRTDPEALAEADLVIVDSAGTLVGRPRAGSPVAAQARQMAEEMVR